MALPDPCRSQRECAAPLRSGWGRGGAHARYNAMHSPRRPWGTPSLSARSLDRVPTLCALRRDIGGTMRALRALAVACAVLALGAPPAAAEAPLEEDEQTTAVRYAYSRHVLDHRPVRGAWNVDARPPQDVRMEILAPRVRAPAACPSRAMQRVRLTADPSSPVDQNGARVASRQGGLRVQVSVQGMDVPGQGHFGLFFDNDTELVLPCHGMRERRGGRGPRRLDVHVSEVGVFQLSRPRPHLTGAGRAGGARGAQGRPRGAVGERRLRGQGAIARSPHVLPRGKEHPRSHTASAQGANFTTHEANDSYHAPAPRMPLGVTDPARAAREPPARGLGAAHFTVPGRPKRVTDAPSGGSTAPGKHHDEL